MAEERVMTIPNTDIKVRLTDRYSPERVSKYIDCMLDGIIVPPSQYDDLGRQLKAVGIAIDDDDLAKLKDIDFNTMRDGCGAGGGVAIIVLGFAIALF